MTSPPNWADGILGPLLISLRDCLEAELADTVAGPVARVTIEHNQATPLLDACTCEQEINGRKVSGQAWIRVVREDLNVGQGLGVGAAQTFAFNPDACPLGWIATLELGAVRCHPTPEDPRTPLPVQTITDTALSRRSDRNALARVVKCCEPLDKFVHLAQAILPLGGAGDCSGYTMSLQVEMPDNLPCVER